MPQPGIVDLHAHFVPAGLISELAAGSSDWRMESRYEDEYLVLRVEGRDMLLPCTGVHDVAQRIKDMDATGVQWHVMSAMPFLFYYWAQPDLAVRMAQLTNESMAEAVRMYPDRLMGLASVPFSHPDAIGEARRAVEELGLHGFGIGTEFRGEQVDGPRFRALFELAAELDVPIFVHPHHVTTPAGLEGRFLLNLVGNPMATTIALGRFAFSGIQDELPGLRTVWAHLGGYVSLAVSRLEHGARSHAEAAGGGTPPREVIRNVWVDALNHDIRAVRFAAEILGRDRIVVGTDYCAQMGISAPDAQIREIATEDPELADLIAYKNARAILPALNLD